jgi:hypothetical protein
MARVDLPIPPSPSMATAGLPVAAPAEEFVEAAGELCPAAWELPWRRTGGMVTDRSMLTAW